MSEFANNMNEKP